jgi:hypothetical protein
MFHAAIKKVRSGSNSTRETNHEENTFLHLQYHPRDPPSSVLQRAFRDYLLNPWKEPPLGAMKNMDNHRIEINRLIIAYSRPPNLKNSLFPRRFKEIEDFPISAFVRDNLEYFS